LSGSARITFPNNDILVVSTLAGTWDSITSGGLELKNALLQCADASSKDSRGRRGSSSSASSSSSSSRAVRTASSCENGEKWIPLFKSYLLAEKAKKNKRTSLANSVQQSLIHSIESSSTMNTDLEDVLCSLFMCAEHPIGRVVRTFTEYFSYAYGNEMKDEFKYAVNPIQTQHNAYDDTKSFLSRFSSEFVPNFLQISVHGSLTVDASSDCQVDFLNVMSEYVEQTSTTSDDASSSNQNAFQALASATQRAIFPTIFTFLIKYYHDEFKLIDTALSKQVKQIKSIPSVQEQFAIIGIDDKDLIASFLKDYQAADTNAFSPSAAVAMQNFPFLDAIDTLCEFGTFKTPQAKLRCLTRTSKHIEEYLSKYVSSFGADEFLPVFTFVLVQADIDHLNAECKFVEDFMDADAKFSMSGYLFTQLQVAIGFLKQQASKI